MASTTSSPPPMRCTVINNARPYSPGVVRSLSFICSTRVCVCAHETPPTNSFFPSFVFAIVRRPSSIVYRPSPIARHPPPCTLLCYSTLLTLLTPLRYARCARCASLAALRSLRFARCARCASLAALRSLRSLRSLRCAPPVRGYPTLPPHPPLHSNNPPLTLHTRKDSVFGDRGADRLCGMDPG